MTTAAGLLASAAVGVLLAHLLKVPYAPLLGAMVGAGGFQLVAHGDGALPGTFSFAGEVLVGAVLGSQLRADVLRAFRRWLQPAVLVAVSMALAGLALGWGLHGVTGVDVATSLFGMMPGGIAQMTAAAAALGGAGPLVAAMQMVRLLVVTLALPLLMRRLGAATGQAEDTGNR